MLPVGAAVDRPEVLHLGGQRAPSQGTQNAFIERFNKTYRTEVLNAYLFASISEVQQITDDWLIDYNEQRPHDSLGRVPPLSYLPRDIRPAESSFELCP